MMCKSLVVLAVLAVTAPSLAFAGEAQQPSKPTGPAITATQMSDAEMDKVTAGTGLLIVTPLGTLPGNQSGAAVLGAGQVTGGVPNASALNPGHGTGAASFSQ